MTNQELLLAISDMMDQKLQTGLQSVKSEWKTDLQSIQAEWKEELHSVKSEWKEELQSVRSEWKAELQLVKDDLRDIRLELENTVKAQILLLAENYVPAARRFEEASGQLETLQSDMELVKEIIAEHSEKLEKLA